MISAMINEVRSALGNKKSNGMKRRVSAMYKPTKEREAVIQARMSEDPFERFGRQLNDPS